MRNRLNLVTLMIVAVAIAGCVEAKPAASPSQASEQVPPRSAETPPAATEPAAGNNPSPSDIVFEMKDRYRLGGPVEIRIRNQAPTATYYYQSYYPACYNLKFFDSSTERRPYPREDPGREPFYLLPGQFIVPEGTHCDLIVEKELKPGQAVTLLTWTQDMCIRDVWGCLESVPASPGDYKVVGEFAQGQGVIKAGGDRDDAKIASAEWRFVIESAAALDEMNPTPTPLAGVATVTPNGAVATATPFVTRAAPELVDTYWELVSLNGESLIAGTRISLAFVEDYLRGSMSCNRYGGGSDRGRYQATSQGDLSVAAPAVTAQFCTSPEGLMNQEQAYIKALRGAASYRLSNDRLEISDDAGRTNLVYVQTDEYTCWDMPAIEVDGIHYGSLEELTAAADVIVRGTITDIDVVADQIRGRPDFWAVHTLLVSQVFKGDLVADTVTAGTIHGCKEKGGEYILFLSDRRAWSPRTENGFVDDPEKPDSPAEYVWLGRAGEFLIKDGAVFPRDPGRMSQLYPPGTPESELVEDILEVVQRARAD